MTATAVRTLAPLHRTAPPRTRTNGDIAAGVGADMGLTPDAEQRWLLDAIFAEDDRGLPASYEVGVVAPRQNLKSATLEIAALTDLYVYGVELAVWTAHEFKTARKSFEDMRRRIMRHPDYAGRTRFRDSHGEEAIYLDSGERLEFHARSGGSGRGFTCSKLTLDEAMFLQPGDLGALVPTMFTVPEAQVRYGSSAGKASSAALRAIRNRGRNPQPGDSLAYVEYGAPWRPCEDEHCSHEVGVLGCALDDRDLWWSANCALWAGRAGEDSVDHQRRALPPEEFMREFLSWWDDPAADGGGDLVAEAPWMDGEDPESQVFGTPTFGLALTPDRSTASIGVAGVNDAGRMHLEVVEAHALQSAWDLGQRGTAGLVAALARMCRENGAQVVLDGKGPASELVPALHAAGVRFHVTTTEEFVTATTAVVDAVEGRRVAHLGDPGLTRSVLSAWRRMVGDRFVIDRKKSDASQAESVVMAAHGVDLAGGFNIW